MTLNHNSVPSAHPSIERSKHTLNASKNYLSPNYTSGVNRSIRYENSSKDGSRRRLSHSPVSVNIAYELCPQNTEKLWRDFSNNLNKSMSRGSLCDKKIHG